MSSFVATRTNTWLAIRQTAIVFGLFALLWFSWKSHSVTLFNGLASPLFFALAAYLLVLATKYRVAVSRSSLLLFLLFAGWVVLCDLRSGESIAALAMDSHWIVLPLATILIAQVFEEYAQAFQFIRVGAALCIVYVILTLFVEAEWYENWHYPPIFGHIRHLGLSIGFMTILLFSPAEATAWVTVFFRTCRILGLALVFWSGTRASMLAWLCCIAVFIYADRRWAKVLLADTAIALALALVPDSPLPNDGVLGMWRRSYRAASADALSSSRLAMWTSTLSGLQGVGNLWTGVGGNGFARLQVMHGVVITPPGHVHAHNVIVQSICDWGLVGFTLLGGFFYRSVFRPIFRNRGCNNPTALAGVVYLLVTGMLDATLYHLEHLNYLAIALASLIANKQPRESNAIVVPMSLVIASIVGFAALHTLSADYRIGLDWYFPTR